METPQIILIIAVVLIVAVVVWFLLGRRGSTQPASAQASKVAGGLGASLRNILGGGLGADTWEALEEVLLSADIGVAATDAIVTSVRKRSPDDAGQARQAVVAEIRNQFGDADRTLNHKGNPAVFLVVGVNGTGKTTSIAKLARHLQSDGHSVVLGAADTFRAAAAEQLVTWGDRLGVQVVRGAEGGDPASVAFDAVTAARARDADVVIIDTAGRLHGKKNLMAELSKIHRVASGDSGRVDEVLLVLDATAGQNGLTQVREFAGAVPLTGIILSKLDGTARGGIVVAVEKELGVPVKFVGLGEGLDDLRPFDPDDFVADLMETA